MFTNNSPGFKAPHSLETERSILGAIFLDNRSVHAVLELRLHAEEFYLDSHQKIFEVIMILSEKNKPIDLITVTEELKNRGWFETTGGSSTLLDLFEHAFAVGNLAAYVEIIQNKSKLRKIVQIGSEIASDALGEVPDTESFMDEVEKKVFGISGEKKANLTSTLKDVFIQNLQFIEEMALKKTDVPGLKTGFRDLDRMTGGLAPGQLIILAARPAMGKTSLALCMCRNVVKHDPEAVVAVFSLEMNKSELGLRLLSESARIPANRLKTGNLTTDDWGSLISATKALSSAKVEINDTSDSTVLDIKSICRRILARYKRLDLIVIDYLQLMNGTRASKKGEGTREREVSEISRNLKSLSKELNVPVIALSQLNRSLEGRPNKRPILSDLRESGSIEADADIVAFIHRDPDSENKSVAELIVAKHRGGPTDTIRLSWLPEFTSFADLDQRSEFRAPLQVVQQPSSQPN